MRLVRHSVNALVTIVLGYWLSRWIVTLPYEFPPLPGTIAAVMRVFGIDTVDNADNVEAIGFFVIVAASMIVAALLVWLANWLVMRRRSTLK